MPDRKLDHENDHAKLTAGDFNTILEVNRKAIELQLRTEDQYDDIIEKLEKSHEKHEELEDKIDEMDKSLFRLLVVLGTIGISTAATVVAAIIKVFLH